MLTDVCWRVERVMLEEERLLLELLPNQRDFDAMCNVFAHMLTYADVC
jgi:hypothetical protein